ncbi:MAG TPA: SUMF1/EgtB/PvdO family nonheme iron enzyme [Polyangia bacterium]|nr:SUMF1/EgtB/PvdO family nonheme iron enzyme [Polyangia bacterium]
MAAAKKPGDRVCGRYEIRALVAEKPLGALYRAFDREIEIEVALRLIAPELLPDGASRRAFMQRLQRSRGLSHSSLLRVYDVALDGEQVAVAVQWVLGPTLRERIDRRAWGTPPLSADEARPILRQVRSALGHVHQLGLTLGDLRADTVMALPETVKLTNVGIAPALPRKRYLEAMRGSAAWSRLAPEIRAGLPPDARADVYALAILTYEMLCGAMPDPQPRPSAWVTPALVAVLERALADDPLLRPPSAEALGEDVERALSGAPPPKPRAPKPSAPPPFVGEDTVPTPKIDPLLQHDDKTRQVDEQELDRLRGREVTRQASEDEIFPLRVQSTDTQTLELEMEAQYEGDDDEPADDLSLETRPHAKLDEDDGEHKTERVHLLEPDAAKTVPVEKLDPAEAAEGGTDGAATRPIPRVEAIEFGEDTLTARVEKLAPEEESGDEADEHELEGATDPAAGERVGAGAFPIVVTPPTPASSKFPPIVTPTAPTELPLVEPPPEAVFAPRPQPPPLPPQAQPPPPPQAQPPLPQPPPAQAPAPTSPAPRKTPPAFPQVAPPPPPQQAPPPLFPPIVTPATPITPLFAAPAPAPRARELEIAPRPAPPPVELPSIEVRELPVEPAPVAQPWPAPAPPKPVPLAAPLVAPLPSRKKRTNPTMMVAPLPAPPSARRLPMLALLLVASGVLAVTAIAVGVVHHMRELRLERDRADKQRLADQLRAQAEALRHPQAEAPTPPPPAPKPIASPPLPLEGPCPLGAALVAGRAPFCIDLYEYPGGKTIPRTEVRFDEAARLCGLRGERLCSDVEWERACRGKNGASYPYGQSFDATRCNTKGGGGEIAPAGTFASCRSASGAYDMSGNVAEWVSSRGAPAQKGGSAETGNPQARCSNVVRSPLPDGAPFVGFRCCADPVRR